MEKVNKVTFLDHVSPTNASIKFGRRYPLIIGGVWQSCWLFVFAAAGTARDPTTDKGIGKCALCRFCPLRSLTYVRLV